MKRKLLKFRKQEIADLTKEEQNGIVGGLAPTVGDYCTNTCSAEGGENENECCPTAMIGPWEPCYGNTGDCPSLYGGGDCDPASNVENLTCYASLFQDCHTDQECTYANCTDGCPNTYGDGTCQ